MRFVGVKSTAERSPPGGMDGLPFPVVYLLIPEYWISLLPPAFPLLGDSLSAGGFNWFVRNKSLLFVALVYAVFC